MLVLCSTNTWRAYNGARSNVASSLHAVIGTDGLPNSKGRSPAFCLYRRHAAGQGTYQVRLRMPGPLPDYVLYEGWPAAVQPADACGRFLHTWLEREAGIDLMWLRTMISTARQVAAGLPGRGAEWAQ